MDKSLLHHFKKRDLGIANNCRSIILTNITAKAYLRIYIE